MKSELEVPYVIEREYTESLGLEYPLIQERIFFKFKPEINQEERKIIIQDISKRENKNIKAIEFYSLPVQLGGVAYDAATVLLSRDQTPNIQEKKRDKSLNVLRNISALSEDFYLKREILEIDWHNIYSCKLKL